jgi:hypothetical protein
MLEHVQPMAMMSTFVRLLVVSALTIGLFIGVQRARLESKSQVATWLAIAIPLFLWLSIVWELAHVGAFRARPGAGVPALPFAIILPVLIGLPLLLISSRVGTLLHTVPPWWLIGLQVYRVFGGIFLVRWAQGEAPGTWAIPAGTGDVLVGLLALPVALYLRAGGRFARGAATAWNVLGIADLVLAITLGALTSPGRLQMLSFDQPNTLVGVYPIVMVPVFGVPLSIILHGLSLRQLRSREPRPVLAAA